MFRLSDVRFLGCYWWVYLVGAIIWSFYQGIRGYKFQQIFGMPNLVGKERVWLLCVPDFITYLLSTMSGFVSIFIFYECIQASCEKQGSGILLIFLAFYGILGITGKLPYLFDKINGKLPGT
jgi:hypothetical protein